MRYMWLQTYELYQYTYPTCVGRLHLNGLHVVDKHKLMCTQVSVCCTSPPAWPGCVTGISSLEFPASPYLHEPRVLSLSLPAMESL